jgi:hypothetical protein
MNYELAEAQSDSIANVINLASWDRPRSSDELQGFIGRRAAAAELDDESDEL